MEQIRRDFRDLGFVVMAQPNEYTIDFFVYEIEGVQQDGTILFHKKGALSSPDPVETVELSEPFVHGYVKWDGCSNWYFDEHDRGMLHFCDRKGLTDIGAILAACWDITKELLPTQQMD